MNENNEPSPEEIEEKVTTEQDEHERRLEEKRRQDVAKTLQDMGVKVDSERVAEKTERDTNPLAALTDMSEATRIPIPGLAEAMKADEDGEDSEEEEERVEREGSGIFSQASRLQAEKREREKPDKKDPWTRIVPNLGKVKAEEEHIEAYEEVFFSDEPLELDIHIPVRSKTYTVRCRTLNAYEREISAIVVKRALENHPLIETATAGTVSEYVFRVDILMMVMKAGDESWPCVRCEPKQGMNPQDDPIVDEILALLAEQFKRLQGRKFALINKALHKFEVICDILDDAVINGDFTDPAD